MYKDPRHLAFIRVNQWMHAVEMQKIRIIGPYALPDKDGLVNYRLDWNQKQRDLDFFLIALNRLRKAVAAANKHLQNKEIFKALQEFDKEIPDVKDLRDIAEHFDKYDLGEGYLEKRLTNESPTIGWGEEDASVNYRGKTITVQKACESARNLHKVVMDLLSRSGNKLVFDEWPLIKYKNH